MTGAAARAALTEPARNLLARDGGTGGRRAGTLRRRIAGSPDASLRLGDLAALPAWLGRPDEARLRLARHVALLAMAPALAASIDGAWLGALAERAGEDLLDDALAHADAIGDEGVLPVAADTIDDRGLALLRATLPPNLQPLLDGPGTMARGAAADDTAFARRCLVLADGVPA